MEDAAPAAATADRTGATRGGTDATPPAAAEVVDMAEYTLTKKPPSAAKSEKNAGIVASAVGKTGAGPAASPVHLAGFADATPAKKIQSPLWKVTGTITTFAVGGAEGVLTTATSGESEDGGATPPKEEKGEKKDCDDALDDDHMDADDEMSGERDATEDEAELPESKGEGGAAEETIEIANDNDEREESEIVVTPAAETVIDAIRTEAVTAATLTEEQQGDDENEHRDDDDALEGMDPVDRAAREAAASLNREALYSTYESNFAALQGERDDLRRQLAAKNEASSKQNEEHAKLKREMEQMKLEMEQKDEEQEKTRGTMRSERNAREETERQLACSQERTDRVEMEADGLRAEIARLTKSNEEYNALLNSVSTQHSKSSSEAVPLRLQVKRLDQELAAVTAHSDYLDGELASRSEAVGVLRQSHSAELRVLRGELDQARLSLEQRERDLSSARTSARLASSEADRLQRKLYDKEVEYVQQKELLERDLNQERELVSLKEQRMLLAEDQRAALTREVEELKSLAKEAADEATAQAEEFQQRLNEGVEAAVGEVREKERQRREELQERLEAAEEAKLRMEEDVLNRSMLRKRRIDGAEVPLAIRNDESSSLMLEEDGDPLSLTDLYTRLAATEDELRASRHSNQKLNILIDRIHRDVAAKTPIFHQKQLELEGALEELDVANERLEYARREAADARADVGDLELKCREAERECAELRRENVDLATQVQSLLQRRSAGSEDLITFDDVASLQGQNQKLLRDHRSMSEKIAELETRIRENPDEIELKELRFEVVSLREEREEQSKLVAGIVHQRDLYRALVAKNDAPFLAGREGQQLALADAKAEQLPLIEARNHDLSEELARAKAENSCVKHEAEALSGRLARVDAHANELTTSNERLRGELTATKATAARLEIDVSHYQGKCERLESSMEMLRAENKSESRRKGQLEELLGKTQSHLEAVRGELAKKEHQYQQASSKTRLLEVQLQTSVASEKRLESDAASLRSEIARQETLLSSVQRIEASLTAKSESELEKLQEDLQRLREAKLDDEMKHCETVQRLECKIADLEDAKTKLAEEKETASVAAAKSNLEGEKSKVTIQELTLKLKASEKELTAAKVKLGDVTIDTSVEEVLEAKVASLTTELESTKSDLVTAQKRITDLQTIAKAAEQQCTELTAASTKYKDDTTASLDKLRKSEQSQMEAVAELTKDLMSHRDEKNKAVSELKAKVDSLTTQLAGAKEDSAKATSRMESLAAEAKRYQLDATNANVNYDRELALHSEARTALREARTSLESEQRLRETAEEQLASAKADVEAHNDEWESSKAKLEDSLKKANSRLEDMRRQNNLLHDQMTSLSSTVEKFQSDRASRLVGSESAGASASAGADASSPAGKQLSDLRELLRFKQSECTMLEADLASAKRALERERTAVELAKRSVEEAQSELKALRETDKAGAGSAGEAEKKVDGLRVKLKSAEEQLLLIRESNTMLREESQKVSKKMSEVQSQLNKLRASTAPQSEKMKGMEVEQAALVAEKDSLAREVEAWKNRVHSLVSKFHQIDPEEHVQALASVEKLKEECASLKTKKEQADANFVKTKGTVTRLNKEISSHKASIEMFKASLQKSNKEKEDSTKLANKKIAEAQAATKKAESHLKQAKTEVDGLSSRVNNFRKMMQKMQAQLKDAKQAEASAKSCEECLQKEITSLKQKLDLANAAATEATAKAAAARAEAATAEAAMAGEKPQATKEVKKEAGPVLSVEKTVAQPQQVIEKKETQEVASSTAIDSSSKPSAATDTAKTKVQHEAKKGEVVDKATGAAAAANKDETKKAGADAAAPGTKKGKKRKANSPKKNVAAAASTAEGTKAPPQKKASPQPTAKKNEVPTVDLQPTAAVTRSAAAKKDSSDALASTESAKALIALSKGTQKKLMAAKKDIPSAFAASTNRKEEEMKLKMLKKRKAVALAKKAEAEKLLAAKKKRDAESSASSEAQEASEKSSKESDASNASKSKPKESLMADKSQLQTAPSTSPKRLSPVPEQGAAKEEKSGSNEKSAASDHRKDTAPKDPVQKKMVFGSSATLTTPPAFGVPNSKPMQSEPDCPKPSFFGAASPTPSAFGGAAAQTFGGATPAKTAEESKSGGNSGAFLDLTPPGKIGGAPGKFVFGKSANITLAVPSGSPMTAAPKSNFTSFGQTAAKFGSTPFGGGFGGAAAAFGASPFGGGDTSKKRPLANAAEESGGEPEAKQSRTEEGEVTDDVPKAGGTAAESSNPKIDAAKDA